MKKFIEKHRVTLFIFVCLFFWRFFLFTVEQNRTFIPQKPEYLGELFQSNFDGVYYSAISQYWYRGLDQAFFPFYPITIKFVSLLTSLHSSTAGIIVSVTALFLLLKILSLLMDLDGFKNKSFWAVILYVSFPTSFFFSAVYTESLFLLLTLLSFYFARKKMRYTASLVAAFASATRIIGIFLLPSLFLEFYSQLKDLKLNKTKMTYIFHFLPLALVPVGLFSYMVFLWYKYGDPLLFVHIQPYFGAGRSGGGVILLPQVLYRYVKIFMSVSPSSFTFFIAGLELATLVLITLTLILALKTKIKKSYILFAFLAIYFPTLSGTLSSLPRYAMVCFAVFIYLSLIRNDYIKLIIFLLFIFLQVFLAMLFFQGYFVS